MSKLKWDQIGERIYETGLDHGVLYPVTKSGTYDKGVAWNGLSAVNESPSGAEANPVWADNIKYLNLISAEDFGATVEAYTYPPEFEECDGSAEIAPGVIGNDVDGQDHGYKLHLIYGAQASPSEKNRATINDSPEAVSFSWELSTTPVDVPGYKPTAHLAIDSTRTDAAKMKALEDILYGSETAEPRLPMPEEIMELFKDAVTVVTAAENADATLLGKKVSDLQSNIVVGENAITGSLKHVTGYTGFSSKTSEQEGHYLALKFDVTPADAVTTVELVGGTKGPVTLDADQNIVLLVKSNTQSVKVVSTKGGFSVTKVYALTGLTLEA